MAAIGIGNGTSVDIDVSYRYHVSKKKEKHKTHTVPAWQYYPFDNIAYAMDYWVNGQKGEHIPYDATHHMFYNKDGMHEGLTEKEVKKRAKDANEDFMKSSDDFVFFVDSDITFGEDKNAYQHYKKMFDRDAILQYLNGVGRHRTKAILLCGDIVNDNDDYFSDFKEQYADLFRRKLIRLFCVPGNHDVINKYGPRKKTLDYIRESINLQRFPTNTGVSYLDNDDPNDPLNEAQGSYYSWFDIHGIRFFACGICPNSRKTWARTRILTKLTADLLCIKTSDPIVIFFHYNISGQKGNWWSTKDQLNFYNAIKNYNVLAVFFGHSEYSFEHNWNPDSEGGGKTISCYAVGGNRFAKVEVSKSCKSLQVKMMYPPLGHNALAMTTCDTWGMMLVGDKNLFRINFSPEDGSTAVYASQSFNTWYDTTVMTSLADWLYIAQGKHLYKVDPEIGSYESLSTSCQDATAITSLNGLLYIVKSNDLYQVNIANNPAVFRNISNSPGTWYDTTVMTSLAKAEVKDDRLYIAQGKNLYQVDPENGSYESLSTSCQDATAITTLNGLLYIVKSNDLYQVNIVGNTADFRNISKPPGTWHDVTAMTSFRGLLYIVQSGNLFKVTSEGAWQLLEGKTTFPD